MDTSKPLPEKILIEIEHGEHVEGNFWQEIIYETTQGCCTFCGIRGHELTSCRKRALARKMKNKSNMSTRNMMNDFADMVDEAKLKKKRGNNSKEAIFEEPVQVVTSINNGQGNEAPTRGTTNLEDGKVSIQQAPNKHKKPTVKKYVQKVPKTNDTQLMRKGKETMGQNPTHLDPCGEDPRAMVVYKPIVIKNSFGIQDQNEKDDGDTCTIEKLQESTLMCSTSKQQNIQYVVKSPMQVESGGVIGLKDLDACNNHKMKIEKSMILLMRRWAEIMNEYEQNSKQWVNDEHGPEHNGTKVLEHGPITGQQSENSESAIKQLAYIFKKAFESPHTPVEQIIGERNQNNQFGSFIIESNNAAQYVHTHPKCFPPLPLCYEDDDMEY